VAEDGGVRSVERAFHLLRVLGARGGEAGLSELPEASGLALPTIHRLIRTLVSLGYVRQLPSRRYALGPGLVWLGDPAGRLLATWARPALESLEHSVQETANLAILDGDRVAYVAQVPSRHQMRMFTEVGRRVLPHAAGVGKAILAQLPDEKILEIVRRAGIPTPVSQRSMWGRRRDFVWVAQIPVVEIDGRRRFTYHVQPEPFLRAVARAND